MSVAAPDRGFSLIELLVVVLIIGVLAAVATPLFLGIRERAADAAVKSDLVTDRTAVLHYGVDHSGSLPPASIVNETDLASYGFIRGPQTVSIDYSVQGSARSGSWCLLATSRTGRVFSVSSHTGVSDGSTSSCPSVY